MPAIPRFYLTLLCVFLSWTLPAGAAAVNATWNAADDVPVTTASYTATGNTVNFTLNFAPATGTNLTVVNNTGLPFISGTFDNLAQGQAVALSYGGVTYNYVAHYYGGTGNDLVLVWANQRLLGWGNNGNGQIGDGTTTPRSLMVPVMVTGVLGGKTIVALSQSPYHSLALCSDGTVAAWGANSNGQLGNNTTTDSYVPAAVNTASGVSALYGKTVVAVMAGVSHSMALCSDGTVAAWGYNYYGELGDKTTTSRSVPVAVNTASGVSALFGKTAVAIAAGNYQSMALCSDGTLVSWGSNFNGELGDTTTTTRMVPVAVNTANGVSALYGKTVTSFTTGLSHSLAICSDGTVVAWGGNYTGRLGDNTTTTRYAPVAVNTASGISALYGKSVIALAAGQSHSMALCSDGTVAAWGDNTYGQLGDNTTTQRNAPVAVNMASGVSALFGKTALAIAVGGRSGSSSGALCADGSMVTWGYNTYGDLGNNSTTSSPVPMVVNTSPLGADERPTVPYRGSPMAQCLMLVAEPSPSLVTLAATTIGGTSATLNGTVNPNNGTTMVSFDYGTTAAYGSSLTATPDTITGGAFTAASATLTGLTPGTTYHYRLRAAGSTGADQIFTTPNNNAGLTDLVPSVGSLSPAFTSGTKQYVVSLSSMTDSITVTPTLGDSNATVTVNGTAVASGSGSGVISLGIGDHVITIAVTAQDGVTRQEYTLTVTQSIPDIIPAAYASAGHVPVSSNGFTATGRTVNLSLDYAPATGTNLTIVNNTGLPFISGTFDNLAQGQTVALSFNGVTYNFVANYYGGTGNDLVLVWANNRAFTWGNNLAGQVGDGTTTTRSVMVPVTATGVLAGKTIISLAEGRYFNLALCSDGTIACWGEGANLGNNTNVSSSTPVLVNTTSGISALYGKTVVAITAGESHSLALCSDGTVVAWGSNGYGELGINSTTASLVPVAVNTASGISALYGKSVVAVAAGSGYSMALCTDGTVATWGYNVYSQLGNNSSTNSPVPVAVNTTSGISALYGKSVVSICAGYHHALALCSDGTLTNWGFSFGGVPVAVNTTVGVSALYGKTVAFLAAADGYTMALCNDGSLTSWGLNNYGQLGTNSTNYASSPVLVNTTSGVSALYGKTVVAIAAGGYSGTCSMALCADGTLTGWGSNGWSDLGNGGSTDSNVAVTVKTTPLAAAERLSSPGSLSNTAQAIALVAGPPPTLAALAATGVSGTSATVNGTVNPNNGYVTAFFDYGTTTAYGSKVAATPSAVTGGIVNPVSTTLTGLTPGTTYHFRIGGTGYTSGDLTFTTLNNDAGLSDLTTSAGALSPIFEGGTRSYSTANVSSETDSITLAPTPSDANASITVNGMSVASGSPATVSLGYGDNMIRTVVTAQDGVTTQIYLLSVYRTLSASLAATFPSAGKVPVNVNGFTATGSTVNFALNYAPATGTNLTVVNNTALPFIQGTFDNLAQGQAVALSYNGVTYKYVANYYGGTGNDLVLVWANSRVFAWGYNNEGELGDGTTTSRSLPMPVSAAGVLTGKTVIAVSEGYNHALALCSDGTVAAWGNNTNGQLGNNSTTASLVPVAVNAASGISALYGKTVVSVVAGGNWNLALCSDGTVATWGSNSSGQLGDGSTTQRNVPVAVNTVSGVSALYGKSVVSLAAGGLHALAVCSDGTVASWGNNFYSQLGDNTTTARFVPMAVNADSGVSALYGKTVVAAAGGSYHSMALCSDGTVTTWGYNGFTQLGDNTSTTRKVPVAVNTTSGVSALYGKTVVAVSAGPNHNTVLCSDGTVAGWGNNSQGQLGDNSTSQRNVPVAVNTASGVSALYGKTVVNLITSQNHSMVQCSDGTLAAWGDNSFGELGDSTTTQRNTPVLVSTSALVAGQQFSILPSSSEAYEWSLAVVAAPAYPAVGTQTAAAISGTSATLYGTVVAANDSMAVSFEYGITTTYGSTATAAPTPVSGGAPAAVSAALTGLQPGTTYHFRVNGVNSAGTLTGNDLTFTTLSNNADLAGLVPSVGTLSPALVSGTLSYTVDVPYLTTSIKVTPTVAEPNAKIKVNGVAVSSGSASASISLAEGSNTVYVVVTAQDGITVQTYILNVVRAFGPTLASLGLSSGTLSPSFASMTTAYTATVPSASATLSLTPAWTDSSATVKINGQSASSGAASSPISLNYGSNTITLVITEADGVSTRTYTLVVSRPLTAAYSSASDVPLTSNGFTATGGTVNFALNYTPATGTNLTVVNNTGLGFISGAFGNLTQGQSVSLSYNGITYNFVANYYGGTGNDLVLVWANSRPFAWGSNSNGQLGDLTTTQRNLPVTVYAGGVLSGKVIVSMAAGGSHTLALCSDGTLVAWGFNGSGQLGDGTTTQRTLPVLVNTASGSALFGKRVIAISAGSIHSLALCSDGTVAAWGNGGLGQLGNGTTGNLLFLPVAVSNSSGSPLFGKTVVAVSAGYSHNLALCSDGTLVSWGYNSSGQLGVGGTATRTVPAAVNTTSGVSVLFGKSVVAIAAGGGHSLALCSDGTLAAWGFNTSGQVGDNSSTNRSFPVAVNTVSGTSSLAGKTVAGLAAGFSHSLVLCSDGSLAAWGSNASGQIGDNSTTDRLVPTAVNAASGVSALSGKTVTAVGAGAYHCLAQTSDNTLTSWGLNSSGQVGDNTTNNDLVAVTVNRSRLTSAEVFTGFFASSAALHTLAMTAAPPVPKVSTLAAASITARSVTLNGTVTANNNTTTVSFEYGPTTAYGTTVSATPDTVAGTTATAVSMGVTGLDPGTTYHFRAKGVNAAGSGNGGDLSFTTLSSNADLANLTLDSVLVNPFFASGTTTYTGTVTTITSSTVVTATVAESHATITVNGVAVASGSASSSIPLSFGETVITTVVTAQDGSTTKTYVVTVTRPTSQQSWRQTYFGSIAGTGTMADAADFDNDGIPNLIEWACMLDPTTRSTTPVTTMRNGANFEFTYSRSTAAANSGAAFIVEWSDTLAAGSWSSTGVTQTVLSDDGTTQQVKAVIPVNGTTAKFSRLSVTAP